MNIKAICLATIALVVSGNVNAALVARLGGLAYYDDVADLTWLADANAAGTAKNWADANAWAASLDVAGVTGWRLPVSDSCINYNCTSSEMGKLFYNTLGNTAGSLGNTGPFSNVQSYYYWSATEVAPSSVNAWLFDMGIGRQYNLNKVTNVDVWAVQSGDVGAVPVPAAAWLFGSGLIGLIGVARRKKS